MRLPLRWQARRVAFYALSAAACHPGRPRMSAASPASSLRATLAEVADPRRLAAAWADVMAADLDDGVLGAGVVRFSENADQNLADISAQLLAGEYRPGWLTPVDVAPRPDGKIRVLHVPTVRDRVVERAILAFVTPVIEPWLGPFRCAYPPCPAVAPAPSALAAFRDACFR